MSSENYKSEIRDSIILNLLEKARKKNYARYLVSVRLEKIRFFRGAQINFDFPVTALIGPNGGGKSTILGAAACAYTSFKPDTFFQKSRVGDNSMNNWEVESEIVDRNKNSKGTLKIHTLYRDNKWSRDVHCKRDIRFFSINRTVPATENPLFSHRRLLREISLPREEVAISSKPVDGINHIKSEAERVLGKSLAYFQLLRIMITRTKYSIKRTRVVDAFEIDETGVKKPVYQKKKKKKNPVTTEKLFFVGSDGENEYSE